MREEMRKAFLLACPLITATVCLAQSQSTHSGGTPTAKKSTTATHRATTTGPTKVTGVGTTTASGLQYWSIKFGTGALAIPGKKAKVQYAGWLTTGKKFDSGV